MEAEVIADGFTLAIFLHLLCPCLQLQRYLSRHFRPVLVDDDIEYRTLANDNFIFALGLRHLGYTVQTIV